MNLETSARFAMIVQTVEKIAQEEAKADPQARGFAFHLADVSARLSRCLVNEGHRQAAKERPSQGVH